ncbi:MAG: hypothetical protein ACI8T1_003276, partial [Verrucomicrobiales bacterium]
MIANKWDLEAHSFLVKVLCPATPFVHMKSPFAFLALTLALGIPTSQGQVLYTEAFDSEESTKVITRETSDTIVRYIDYSDFMVGDESFSITEAPNKVSASIPARGVFFQANLADGAPAAVNLVAAQSRDGEPVMVSGTYKLTFDYYINVADPIPAGGTEQIVWGIGTENSVIHSRANREDTNLQGVWGWLSGENGFGTEDSVVYAEGTELERKGDGDNKELWNAAFDEQREIPGIPAGAWTQVTIEVFSDLIQVSYNGELFHALPITSVNAEGFPLFGYEDAFGSISDEQDFQWGIIDNVVVESIVEPALTVASVTPFEVVTTPGGTSVATFSLTNKRENTLTLTQANLTGDAELFEVITALPLTIPAGELGTLEVSFNPGTASGKRTATLELLTDDPDTPPTILELEASRFGELLAEFRFDDTGNPPLDSSGNDTAGSYVARSGVPHGFGEPSLIGGNGNSVSFSDDHAAGTGNWVSFDALHTPSVSISVWIKPDEGSGADVIFNRNDTVTFVDSDGIYGLALNEDGSLNLRIRNEDIVSAPPGTITTGTTYHVAFTHRDDDGFDNETALRTRLYINGALVDEAGGVETLGYGDYPENAAATDLHFATRVAAGSGYAGAFDELQIYRVELEPKQIEQLFSDPEMTARFDNPNLFASATGDFGDVVGDQPTSKVITLANSGDSETLTISDTALTGSSAFKLSELPASLAPGEKVDITVTFDPKGQIGSFAAMLALESNDESDASVSVSLSARVANPSGLIAHYKLDETSGTDLADASGNGRTAALKLENGGSVEYAQEALASGTSIRLKGGDDSVIALVEIPTSAALPALPTYTVSMWFELDPADEGTASVLFSQGSVIETASALALLAAEEEGPLQWVVNVSEGEITAEDLVKSRTPYHLVVIHEDSSPAGEGADRLSFYINGALVETIEDLDASIISGPNS